MLTKIICMSISKSQKGGKKIPSFFIFLRAGA
nr:MAG TPA: hypothetical protein [Caudoviricetes sp.]